MSVAFDACSSAYDNNFSYGFMYHLRNYAQHCGMPIGSIVLGSKLERPNSNEVRHYLGIYFSRDELLEKYDQWPDLLINEIKELPPKFEVKWHVAKTMNCLENIHVIMIRDDLSGIAKSVESIERLVAETAGKLGTPCILKDLTRKQEGLGLTIEHLPLDLLELAREMLPKLKDSTTVASHPSY